MTKNDVQTESTEATETPAKVRFRDALKRKVATDEQPKAKTPLKEKAKNAAAVVGVVAVIGAAAGVIANRGGKKASDSELDFSDTEVTTEEN